MAQNTQMEPYMAIATLSIERAAPTMTDTQAAASICDYPVLRYKAYGIRIISRMKYLVWHRI